MARIRGRDTKPELSLRKALHSMGLRYRVNRRLSFGRPDLVFARHRCIVFVDGCFWHGCPDHYIAPKNRRRFWEEKLRSNVARDERQTAEAVAAGWKVIRLWEHEVEADPEAAARRIRRLILAGRSEQAILTPPRPIRLL